MEDVKIDIPANPNLSKILNSVGSIKINSNNIMQSLHSIMESVENVDNSLKGSDKKSLAIEVINCIVDKQDGLSNEDKQILKAIINQIASQTIDVIIKVSNGISQLVYESTSKCSSCFNF
jgi:hypothetical protein